MTKAINRVPANPLQGTDPNADMVATVTADGRPTTEFWGGGGRPTPNKRNEVPAYERTGHDFDDPDTAAKAAEIIARYPAGHERSALMPLLHLAQGLEGFVSKDAISWIAGLLDLQESEVNGVSSFYTMYKREPVGEHLVSVCTNTLCAALGGDKIFAALKEQLGVGNEGTAGEPGEPGSVTLEHVECLACCDHGPVFTVDYEIFDAQTPESAVELVAALRRGEKPHPTRGAPLRGFRAAELELAGFWDGDEAGLEEAVDSPSATPQSLRGVALAAEHGWTAPAMPDPAPAWPALPEKK